MEHVLFSLANCSLWLVPIIAMWSVVCLYWGHFGGHGTLAQAIYLTCLLAVAGLTVRTVMVDDGCWLMHTTTLGIMIVLGAMLKPAGEHEHWVASNS